MSLAGGAQMDSSVVGEGSRGDRGPAPSARRLMRFLVLAPMIVYSKVISPAMPRRCKYEPTCSAYAIEAVRDFGALRGLVLAGWRLLRCNPFSDGGYDPVQAQRLFRQDHHATG